MNKKEQYRCAIFELSMYNQPIKVTFSNVQAGLTIIALLLIGQATLNAQHIRPKVQRIAKEIAKSNQVFSHGVRVGRMKSEMWKPLDNLAKTATRTELLILTDHLNPSVRCYAFLALAKRKDSSIMNLLVKHLYDTAKVISYQGCITSKYRVGDYFLEVVTSEYDEADAYKLTKDEEAQIDSVLVFDERIALGSIFNAMKRAPVSEKHYHRLREIYLQKRWDDCIVLMSGYQNQNDKELIKDLLADSNIWSQWVGLRCARNFPDPDFFPYIKAIHERESKEVSVDTGHILTSLYRAVVQYKDSASRKLIENILYTSATDLTHEHTIYIMGALERFPDPVYNGLKELIHPTEFDRITIDQSKLDYFD